MELDLEDRLKQEDKLNRLHKEVWLGERFNEKKFYKYNRAVEDVGERYPGLYAEHYHFLNMYYVVFIKYS